MSIRKKQAIADRLPALERMPAVKRRTGLSKSAIYRRIRDGYFPSPIRLGERAVAWRSSEISAWIEARESTHA